MCPPIAHDLSQIHSKYLQQVLEIYGKEYDVHWGEVTNTFTKVKAQKLNELTTHIPDHSDCCSRLDPGEGVGRQGGDQGGGQEQADQVPQGE